MSSGSVVLTADWVGLVGAGGCWEGHTRGARRTTPMGKSYDSGFHCVLFRFLRELVVRHSRVTSVPTASGTRGALGAEDGVLSLADSKGIWEGLRAFS